MLPRHECVPPENVYRAMLAAYSPIPPRIIDWAASQSEAIEAEKAKPGYDPLKMKSMEEMRAEHERRRD